MEEDHAVGIARVKNFVNVRRVGLAHALYTSALAHDARCALGGGEDALDFPPSAIRATVGSLPDLAPLGSIIVRVEVHSHGKTGVRGCVLETRSSGSPAAV